MSLRHRSASSRLQRATFFRSLRMEALERRELLAGDLVISEFRLRGPNGANDEFVEIYNDTDAPYTVAASDASAGFAVAASNGVARFVIPNGTVIPARGHYLGVNSVGYSLSSYPAGNGATATGDSTYTTDIPDNAGIALFNTANAANFILANRLDAVGSTSEANTLYKEGAGYPALTPFSIDYSFYRSYTADATGSPPFDVTSGDGLPKDTNDNAADLVFVDTNGTSAGAGQRLGAPGPENLSSPIALDPASPTVLQSLVDPGVSSNDAPNRVRDFTSDPANNSTFGTLDFRRTFTNDTGSSITRLRFRIINLSTFPAASGIADLRPRTSTAVVVSTTAGNVTVQGTTLEQPPSQPNGGGFNSSLSAGVITLATPLVDGDDVDLRFLFGLQQTGAFRIGIIVETLPGGSSLWELQGTTEIPTDFDFGDAPDTYGTLLASGGARHGTSALRLGAAVDGDTDGQPTAAADGDDTSGVDDEDGVALPSTLIAGVGTPITVTASAAGFLDAWIDFNRNGVFEAAEQIATGQAVVAGANELAVVAPPSTVAGISYARFRLSSAGGLSPAGETIDGEVEDYTVTLVTLAPSSATVVPDPQNPGGNLLLVNGTSLSEAILVRPVPGQPGQVQVLLSGEFHGPFALNSFSRIEVFGRQGSDSIVVDAALVVPATLHGGIGNDSMVGGSGNDTLYGDAGIDSLVGGAGHDVLLGGIGVDYLLGGLGNDVLIGGIGADWLYGLEGDDLLIGGSTTHDGNFAALNAIIAAWSSAASFDARVATLAPLLNAGTVIDDAEADFLLGSLGRDWMLDFALQDLFLDFDPNPVTGDRKN